MTYLVQLRKDFRPSQQKNPQAGNPRHQIMTGNQFETIN